MFHVAPLGLLMHGAEPNHGLTPVATTFRPVGTESQGAWNATTVDVLAAARRYVVAMGASPWNT